MLRILQWNFLIPGVDTCQTFLSIVVSTIRIIWWSVDKLVKIERLEQSKNGKKNCQNALFVRNCHKFKLLQHLASYLGENLHSKSNFFNPIKMMNFYVHCQFLIVWPKIILGAVHKRHHQSRGRGLPKDDLTY